MENKYQEALEIVRNVNAENESLDYLHKFGYDVTYTLQEAVDKANKYDELTKPHKPILKHCPKCGVPLSQWKGHRFFKCCPMCETRLNWGNEE